MENTFYHFILTLKNGYIIPIFCIFFGMRNRKDNDYDNAEYLGENMPFSIMDEIKTTSIKADTRGLKP